MCKRFVMSGEKKMVLKNVGACENNNLTVHLWIVATLLLNISVGTDFPTKGITQCS